VYHRNSSVIDCVLYFKGSRAIFQADKSAANMAIKVGWCGAKSLDVRSTAAAAAAADAAER